MFKGNEKFIDPPLRLFDFFNTRKRKWMLSILYLIYKLILQGILILGSRKSSRYQTTLQNSQIPLVGLGGTFACYHALTRALNNYLARRAVDPLFELPENCVSLYLSHLFISSEAPKSAPKKLAIGPRPWSVGTSYMVRYGSLVKDMTGYEHARLFPFPNEK